MGLKKSDDKELVKGFFGLIIDEFCLKNYTALNDIEFTAELFLNEDKVASVFALKDKTELNRVDMKYILANRGIMSYEWKNDTMRALVINMLEMNVRNEMKSKKDKYDLQFVPIVDLLILMLVHEIENGKKYENRIRKLMQECKNIM